MGTNYSFKIRETAVYIYPFKTKWYKNENYFFFESDYKSYFYTKKKNYSMIIVLTWIMPPFGYHYHCPAHMDLSPQSKKKNSSVLWFGFFNIKIPPSLKGGGYHA